MGAVDLAIDMTRINKEHGVGPLALSFAPIEEPQRTRERHRIEHVRTNGHHDIDRFGFNKPLAQLLLAAARVGSRVGHDKASTTFVVERRVEKLNPQVVRVVGPR